MDWKIEATPQIGLFQQDQIPADQAWGYALSRACPHFLGNNTMENTAPPAPPIYELTRNFR